MSERELIEDAEAEGGEDNRRSALRYILDAWEDASLDGIHPDSIATAAIFAALSDMIAAYGEEPVAVMAARLPERIRNGEFTAEKSIQ